MMSPTGRASGFTLLEVMLVLLLISMTAMLVVATLPGNDYRVEREAQRLTDRLHALMRDAALEGRTYGVLVESHRWQLSVWKQKQWQPLSGRYDAGTLPEDWQLTIAVPGQPGAGVPQVLLLPGGDISPFHLRYFHREQAVVAIAPNEDGWPAVTDLRDETP